MRGLFPFISFVTVATAVVVLSVGYLGIRLAQSWPSARFHIWVVVGISAAVIVVSPFLSRYLQFDFSDAGADFFRTLILVVVRLGYFLMGLMGISVAVFLFFDLLGLLVNAFDFLRGNEASVDESRRNFLFKYGPWSALGISSLLALKGFQTATVGPIVKKVSIPKAGLPRVLDGLRILQISDLHVGSIIRRQYVEKVVETALSLKPDVIMLTGDFVDGSPEHLMSEIAPLKNLRASRGIFFVTGNHEYYSGVTEWLTVFESFGFQVLNNSHQTIEFRENASASSSRVLVVGIPDPTALSFGLEGPDILKATKNAPSVDFTILLAHQPNSYRLAEKISCDLQLSGHTHAGQFYPVRWLIGLFHRYYQGLHLHDDKFWVYVNQGTGFWGPPNRLGLPSEITLLELKIA